MSTLDELLDTLATDDIVQVMLTPDPEPPAPPLPGQEGCSVGYDHLRERVITTGCPICRARV